MWLYDGSISLAQMKLQAKSSSRANYYYLQAHGQHNSYWDEVVSFLQSHFVLQWWCFPFQKISLLYFQSQVVVDEGIISACQLSLKFDSS